MVYASQSRSKLVEQTAKVVEMGQEFQAKVKKTLFLGVPGAILACALSHDGEIAVSCSTNKKVLLWNVSSGSCIGSLDGHQNDVNCCSFGNELLVTGSRDGIIYVWKYQTMKRTSRIDVHAGPVHSCVISPNSRFLASSSEDKTVRVYTIQGGDGEFIQGPRCIELTGHSEGVNDVSFSFDSCAIVSACSDGVVKIWDTETGECLMDLPGENKVLSARFSADGNYVIMLQQKCISCWSISKNNVVWTLEDDKGFQSICCHQSENMFVALTMDGAIAGYNVETRAQLFKKGTDHRGPVLSCSFSANGESLVTGGIDGKMLVWH